MNSRLSIGKMLKREKRRKRQGRRDPLGRPILDLDTPNAKYKIIGGSQPVPLFRFTKALHEFRMQVTGGAFKTKTNATIAGGLSQIKGAAAAYGLAFAWSIGDLPFSFAQLFDQYRIKRVILRLSASNNTNTTGIGARLYVVTDYDNSTLLSSAANAQTYQNCQVVRGSDAGDGESIVVDLTPTVPVPSIAGNLLLPAPWQDLAVTTNTHYGVKCWYQTAAVTDPVWDIDAQYIVECINTQ